MIKYLIKIILSKIRIKISKAIFFVNQLELFFVSRKVIKLTENLKISEICIFHEGGFGVLNTLCDRISNKQNKKNFLIINFFASSRFHNIYLEHFFSDLNILNIFLFGWYGKILSKLKVFDIKEKKKLFVFLKSEILKKNKNIKIYDDQIIYKLNSEMIPKNIKKNNNLMRLLKWKVKKYECPIELNKIFYPKKTIKADSFIRKHIESKINPNILNNNKNFCIHIRDKSPLVKNNGNIDDYIPCIKYLLQKKFNIFILGEFKYDNNANIKNLINNNNQIFTSKKTNIKKDIFDFYFPHFCKFAIIAQSGAMTMPTYSNNFIYVPNMYPLSVTWPNSLILYKKITKDKKEIKYSHKIIKQLNSGTYKNNQKLGIENNTKEEILLGLKEYLHLKKTKKNKKYFNKELINKINPYNPLFYHKKFNCMISKQDIKKFI